jgi:hypothetical protein
MIVAGRDSVVPARRSEPLRSAIPNLVFDCTIADAEHNDLYDRADFWSALGSAVQIVSTFRFLKCGRFRFCGVMRFCGDGSCASRVEL